MAKPKGQKRENTMKLAIACEAAAVVPHLDLHRLQGDLKTMDKEDRDRLRDSLVNHGFSFPVHAWKEPKTKKIWVLDAHQRLDIVEELSAEGWAIPPLPVAWVHAKDRKQALSKLAAAASQYGRVTPDGLANFMKMAKLDMSAMLRTYRFPEVNMEKFQHAYFPKPPEEVAFKVRPGTGEVNEDELTFQHNCPKCGFGFND